MKFASGKPSAYLDSTEVDQPNQETLMFLNGISRTRGLLIAPILLISGSAVALNVTTSSAIDTTGVITGRVLECGPGSVVVTPGAPAPTAIPEKVVLIHRGHTFESQSIHFPRKVPWVGPFSFTVPPGTYEVISTYTGPVRWVTVKAGGRYEVGFGLVACAD